MAAPTTLPALLTSLTQSLTLSQEVTPNIAAIEHQKDGISLLDVKNELLLSYLQNLAFLILLKLRNAKAEDDTTETTDVDEAVRSKLVELRLFLEKGARPLEEKLRFSIERFLRAAEDAQREEKDRKHRLEHPDESESGSEDSESDSNNEDEAAPPSKAMPHRPGKSAAAPRFGALIDDVAARTAQRNAGGPNGTYQPPKRERQLMETGRKEKTDRRPNRSRTMEEFVNSELSAAPLAEPSIGTTIVQGGRKMKTADERKDEDERREYEETNYVRLPNQSKKDKAKKAGRKNHMQFGGEEWHDLGEGVDRIDRLTKVKNGGRNTGVRAMLDKSRKRGFDTTDGPRGSGHGQDMGDKFRKKVKMLEGGRRDRGKNRK